MKPRRILENFTITEISAVDKPAQEHALMVLIKGKEPEGDDQMRKIENGPASFDEAVQEFRDAGLSGTAAMQKARARYPDLYRKHQAEPAPVEKVDATAGPAVARFLGLVDDLVEKRRCSRTEALKQARRRFPAQFAEYQSAR